MNSTAGTLKLTGREAIEYAREHGLSLNKYADPTEDARQGLAIWQAEQVVAEDPGLIWLEITQPPANAIVGDDLRAHAEKHDYNLGHYVGQPHPDWVLVGKHAINYARENGLMLMGFADYYVGQFGVEARGNAYGARPITPETAEEQMRLSDLIYVDSAEAARQRRWFEDRMYLTSAHAYVQRLKAEGKTPKLDISLLSAPGWTVESQNLAIAALGSNA